MDTLSSLCLWIALLGFTGGMVGAVAVAIFVQWVTGKPVYRVFLRPTPNRIVTSYVVPPHSAATDAEYNEYLATLRRNLDVIDNDF